MMYLLYPLDGEVEGYPRKQFEEDIVNECEKDIEEVLQEFLIGHVGAVDRIDVTARTDVDADILALLCRKAIEDSIVEFYKERQKVTGGPWVAWIVSRRQAPFREVHNHVCGAGRKTRAYARRPFPSGRTRR